MFLMTQTEIKLKCLATGVTGIPHHSTACSEPTTQGTPNCELQADFTLTLDSSMET
jgi:hypothetical protein